MQTSAPTSEHPSLPAEKPTPRLSNVRNPKKQNTKQASLSAPSTVRTSPKQVFIRRVHAVVEIPVKKEQMDEDQEFQGSSRWKPSSSVEHPPPAAKAKSAVRKPKAVEERRRHQRRIEDEEDDADEDEDYVESGDGVDRGEATYGDDEEDELMMGIEV